MAVRWPRYPLVYEINTRVWLRELSARHGRTVTLATVPSEEIAPIGALGFDAVWLMGVWATGPEPVWVARHDARDARGVRPGAPGRHRRRHHRVPVRHLALRGRGGDRRPRGTAGHPRAAGHAGHPRDPGLRPQPHRAGPPPGARAARRLRARHDGRPGPRPRGPSSAAATGTIVAHGRDPYFPAWTDTAQVNYASRAGREALLQILLRIAAQCDGLRCDMAMLVLPDVFARTWEGRLGPEPVLRQLLEGSHPRRAGAPSAVPVPGRGVLGAGGPAARGRLPLQLRQGAVRPAARTATRRASGGICGVPRRSRTARARFIENHDEPRAVDGVRAARRGRPRSRPSAPRACACSTRGSSRAGACGCPVQLARRPAEPEDDGSADVLRAAARRPPAAHLQGRRVPARRRPAGRPRGPHQRRDGRGDVAHRRATRGPARSSWCPTWRRRRGTRAFRSTPRVSRPGGSIASSTTWTAGTTSATAPRSSDPGLFVALDPYQAHVFEITEAADAE